MLPPLIELHNHLEGSIYPDVAKRLAKRNHLTFPKQYLNAEKTGYQYQDFLDFLQVFDRISELIKQPIDYYDITLDYLLRNAEQGAIYMEMGYSPQHAERTTHIPSIEHLHAIEQAIRDAEAQAGIIGRIFIIAVRHFGVEDCERTIRAELKHRLPCVVGFSLGGDEINYPPEGFKKTFQLAQDGGLPCAIHTGEWLPAESMQWVIRELPIQRIGHGIQAQHCPTTLAMIKDHNITLEICPSSNVMLNCVPSLEAHPLPRFMEAGIKTCLNSDDPPFFHTDLANEYRLAQKVFQFSDETMRRFTENALDAAFADEPTKARLRAKLS